MKLARMEKWIEKNSKTYMMVGVEKYFGVVNRAQDLEIEIAKMEAELAKNKERSDYWKGIDKNAKKLKKATTAMEAFELAKEIMTMAMELQEYDLQKAEGKAG